MKTEMKVIEKRNEDELMLTCMSCYESFWFKPEVNGLNAVETSPPLLVTAKCPKCNAEWDGETLDYYVIGVTLNVLQFVSPSAYDLLGVDDSAEKTFLAVDAVKAENALEAARKFSPPKGLPSYVFSDGLAIIKCSKQTFETAEKLVRKRPKSNMSPLDMFKHLMEKN